MTEVSSLQLPLLEVGGQVVGSLVITLLPAYRSTTPAPLSNGPVPALLEATEYRYKVDLESASPFTTDMPDVFESDTADGLTGRIKTGQLVGMLVMKPFLNGRPLSSVQVEIRSRKLDFYRHYRWMLRDLTTFSAELIMQRFAETRQQFRPGGAPDRGTLYQRFAYLSSLLSSQDFLASWSQIVGQPHQRWCTLEETVRPGQALKATSGVARQLTRCGPRSVHRLPGVGVLLPLGLQRTSHEETRDTPENRFVKYVLQQWQASLLELRQCLETNPPALSVAARARREIDETEARLLELQAAPLLKEVGELHRLPLSSSALQKKSGYREFLRYYIQFQMASQLSWDGGVDNFLASQRNVATLYEYWTYIQLAQLLSKLLGKELNWSQLVEPVDHGLSLNLKQGQRCMVFGQTTRRGRVLQLELWFNRTFAGQGGSWTLPMRPDCSLKVRAEGSEETWVHFDAKYKLDGGKIFGDDGEEESRSTAKRIDLLKMHSYRDAIRRTSGAYILYPGSESREYPLYAEILPGLGAFRLRPAEHGGAEGETELLDFLDKVLDHFSSQFTQHERSRHWQNVVSSERLGKVEGPHLNFLTVPPADTQVLLGYVRDQAHWEWISRHGLYNLRGDPERNGAVALTGPELGAGYVLLYGPVLESCLWFKVQGAPLVLTRERMVEMDYPRQASRAYFCLPLVQCSSCWQPEREDVGRLVEGLGQARGAPCVVSMHWLKGCLTPGP